MFNVESHIKRCLNSILNQDIDKTHFEIIIVDDHSLDNSLLIINDLQQTHQNIKVVQHQSNQGLGAARNTGLKIAKGKYVWFIDSDDYIEFNCLNMLLNKIENNSLDILSFSFYKQTSNGDFLHDRINTHSVTEVLNGKQFLELNFQPTTLSSWSKIYRTQYLRENNFQFTEGVYWEDADFVIRAIYFSDRIQLIKDHLYYYCFNNKSISRDHYSGKKYADLIKMGYRKLCFSKEIEAESPDISLKIKNDAYWNATALKKVFFLNKNERIILYESIKSTKYNEIKKNRQLGILRELYTRPILVDIMLYIFGPLIVTLKWIKNLNR